MPSLASQIQDDAQSFLRTGPETTLHIRPMDQGDATVTRDLCADPVFPPPAIAPWVMARLDEWPCFASLAVRIDAPGTAVENSPLDAALRSCFERFEKERDVLWFRWDVGLYGCVLANIDATAGAALAQDIKTSLAQSRVETVSIGISAFPLLDYDRAASLQNGCKALDHAAFFGPANIVTFDAVSLNICGDHYYQKNNPDAAIEEYRVALKIDPCNVNVRNSLGVCLAQKGDREGARDEFTAVLGIDPHEAMATFNLGVLHLLDENPEQALTFFQRALNFDNQTFEIPFHIGKILTEQHMYAEAKVHLESAIALRATFAPAHSLLGRCLESLGQPQEAIAAYGRAVKLNPNDAAALSALSALYDAKGENPDICLTFCRQSVALCPENSQFRLRLASLYQKYKQFDQALAEFETAATLGCDVSHSIAELQEQMQGLGSGEQCCA